MFGGTNPLKTIHAYQAGATLRSEYCTRNLVERGTAQQSLLHAQFLAAFKCRACCCDCSRFHELPNVFITPHSSGWTQAGTERRRIEEIATNLDALVNGDMLINVVASKSAVAGCAKL